MWPSRPCALALCLLATAPLGAAAQTEITVEAGGSSVAPPVGVDAERATYTMAGLRASTHGPTGSGVSASFLLGRALGGAHTGGDFLSGTVAASLRGAWRGRWSAGFDVRTLGFEVQTPFPYRAIAAEGGPVLRFRTPTASVRVSGTAGAGRSRVELRRRAGGPVRTVEDDLWRVGGSAEVLVGSGGVWVGAAAGAHHTSGGTYSTGGLRVLLGRADAAAELRLDVWDTPLGTETTGGLGFSIPLSGRWGVRGYLGRSEPDPLTLAEPGAGSGGALLGLTLLRTGGAPAGGPPYEVVGPGASGSRVRFALDGAGAAESVAVLGDFTLWQPVTMAWDGDRWVVELEVGPGTHHYGFLVDDEWHMPEDAPDTVPDEWGRRNATLVIEGAAR